MRFRDKTDGVILENNNPEVIILLKQNPNLEELSEDNPQPVVEDKKPARKKKVKE